MASPDITSAPGAKAPDAKAPAATAPAATALDARAALRLAVLRELERLRIAGEIGAPLDAIVEIYAGSETVAALEPLGDELRFALITSEAHVHPVAARPDVAVPADPDSD